jgi:hypothetical protein
MPLLRPHLQPAAQKAERAAAEQCVSHAGRMDSRAPVIPETASNAAAL